MNKLVYIGIIVALFSCKSNSIAQEKEPMKPQETNKVKIQRPILGDPRDNEITAFPVHPKGGTTNITNCVASVLSLEEKNVICDKKTMARLKVMDVKSSGTLVSKEQEISVVFNALNEKNFDIVKRDFSKDQIIELTLRKKHCSDMKANVYEVITYKVKD